MAPEVITEGRLYDSKADIWSLGITLLEMCYGEPPMSGQPAARAVMLIGDKKMRAPRLEGNGWSKDMKDFVVGCLNEEPGDRSPAEELAKMRWIKMQAKTGLGVLNELIVNYKVWKDKGGERQSLAPGVGAKTEDEEDDEEYQHGDWAFDVSDISWITLKSLTVQTVRSRMSMLVDQKAQDGDLGTSLVPPCYIKSPLILDLAPPTARPAPQSLRRLFHDEDSADPDPFQSFAHQQPITPHTSQEGSVDQFAPNPEISFDEDEDEQSFEGTVRQAKPKVRSSLGVTQSSDSLSMASSHAFEMDNDASTPTPIALPQDDDDSDDSDDLGPPQAPFGQGQQLRGKASYDSLSSNPTTRSQISQDPRPAKEIRKPSGGTVGDGLRGFQFPLSKAVMASRPPPLTRNASAMPLSAAAEDENSSLSPSRPGLQRMQSAMPDLQPNSATTPVKPARPQISINLPPRPPMMRHASAAVMEGRAQAQAQAQALAAVDTGAKNLGVPGKPQIGLGVGVPGQVGMSRSRSGSRTEDHNLGLRDLMRVSLIHTYFARTELITVITCSTWSIRSTAITIDNR
jgi:protein-serine/threonine kinase